MLLLVVSGIFLMAILSSVVTSWVTTRQVQDLLVKEGLQVAETVANGSVLAILYHSSANAINIVNSALEFPSIEKVIVYDSHHQIILEKGLSDNDISLEQNLSWPNEQPEVSGETDQTWFIKSPVFLEYKDDVVDENAFPTEARNKELLGHVMIFMSKKALNRVKMQTFLNNSLIAVIIAGVLTGVLWLILGHLTKPLGALSETMTKARLTGPIVYADPDGPLEVAEIAETFNLMMDKLAERDKRLKEHNQLLESEVKLRTKELVEARDVAISANKLKSEFLANTSHELRTPLQSIIGYTELLYESMSDEGLMEDAKTLERIEHNAKHLLDLINSILTYSKLEADKTELDLERVNLGNLITEVSDVVGPLMQKNKNTLNINFKPAGTPTLEIDHKKLFQILLNLLSNAAKFTSEGEVNMDVFLNPKLLEIKIHDTGLGISESDQRTVFEAFRQADGSETRKHEGTGLGLSISRKFAQLMGGSIKLKSTLGVGSTFTLKIPLPIKSIAK